MKINKVIIIFALMHSIVHPYFWQVWKKPETQEDFAKQKVDLKYQEKQARLEHKKQEATAHAQQKRNELNYKQSQLELERKKERLKVDH